MLRQSRRALARYAPFWQDRSPHLKASQGSPPFPAPRRNPAFFLRAGVGSARPVLPAAALRSASLRSSSLRSAAGKTGSTYVRHQLAHLH